MNFTSSSRTQSSSLAFLTLSKLPRLNNAIGPIHVLILQGSGKNLASFGGGGAGGGAAQSVFAEPHSAAKTSELFHGERERERGQK